MLCGRHASRGTRVGSPRARGHPTNPRTACRFAKHRNRPAAPCLSVVHWGLPPRGLAAGARHRCASCACSSSSQSARSPASLLAHSCRSTRDRTGLRPSHVHRDGQQVSPGRFSGSLSACDESADRRGACGKRKHEGARVGDAVCCQRERHATASSRERSEPAALASCTTEPEEAAGGLRCFAKRHAVHGLVGTRAPARGDRPVCGVPRVAAKHRNPSAAPLTA